MTRADDKLTLSDREAAILGVGGAGGTWTPRARGGLALESRGTPGSDFRPPPSATA